MKKNHITRDSIIVGLALFSTMFGAGNLIFRRRSAWPMVLCGAGARWASCSPA